VAVEMLKCILTPLSCIGVLSPQRSMSFRPNGAKVSIPEAAYVYSQASVTVPGPSLLPLTVHAILPVEICNTIPICGKFHPDLTHQELQGQTKVTKIEKRSIPFGRKLSHGNRNERRGKCRIG